MARSSEGWWDSDTPENFVNIASRRNSVSFGSDGKLWFDPLLPPCSLLDSEIEPEVFFDYQGELYNDGDLERYADYFMKIHRIPDSNNYLEEAMAVRGTHPPPDYYPFDTALSCQPPEDLQGFYRGSHQLLSRSGSHYGLGAGGVRSAWDQGQTRATTRVPTPGTAPSHPPLPPPPPPTAHELSRLYRDSLVIPDGQRIRSRAGSPSCIGIVADQASLAGHSGYNEVNGLHLEHPSSTCIMMDPAPTSVVDGSMHRGISVYGTIPAQRMAYDPAYDANPTMGAATPAQLTGGIPSHHPSSVVTLDPKRTVDPTFLSFLRTEGISESSISLLLQQGFDSTTMLSMMEEHDIRSMAPNLGQARVLSRVVHNCKTGGVPTMRGRSNSFSHRNDLYTQPQNMPMDSNLLQQPSNTLQTVSPRIGEFINRRPSSAPSQHLLETTSYPGMRSLGGLPSNPAAYSTSLTQPRPLTMYNPHTGLPMSSQPQQPGIMGTSGLVPRAFSSTYTPIELMKRAPSLPHMPQTPGPNYSPQLLRKGATAVESATMPTGTTGQSQTLNPNNKMARRTGPPVIVSTMASPDTSKRISLINFFLSAIIRFSFLYLVP